METLYFKSVKAFAASCLRHSDYVLIRDTEAEMNVRAWDKRVGDAICAIRTLQTGTLECYDKHGRVFDAAAFRVTRFGVIAEFD